MNDDLLVGGGSGNGFAVNTFAFFRIPFNIGGAIGDFAARFGERFALFQGEEAGEFVLMRHDEFKPAAQDAAACFGGFCPPCGQGGISGGDRLFGFLFATIGHMAEPFAGGGVMDGNGGFAQPLAVDITVFAQ